MAKSSIYSIDWSRFSGPTALFKNLIRFNQKVKKPDCRNWEIVILYHCSHILKTHQKDVAASTTCHL